MCHQRLCAILVSSVLVTVTAPGAVHAQELTPERAFASGDFSPRRIAPVWVDAARYALVEPRSDESRNALAVVEAATGRRTPVIDDTVLPPDAEGRQRQIENVQWSHDRRKLLIFTDSRRVWRANTKGRYFVYDLETGTVTPLSDRMGWQMFAKFSPDASRVGFVRDNDLWIKELASGDENRLTRDGSDVVVSGASDWVYEEEFGVRDAWRWSPDGQSIAFWRFDQSPVPKFPMVHETGQPPAVQTFRFPFAGEANSEVRIGVVDVAGGAPVWIDLGPDLDVYVPRMGWIEGTGELWIQRLNRHQNRLDLLLADPETGASRVFLTDSDSAWVEVDDDLRWLDGGRQLLWTSERDGHKHVYLYHRSANGPQQLTRGGWDVTAIAGIDERNGWVYFLSTMTSPTERQLYRVPLSGGAFERVTQEPGVHAVNMSPSGEYFFDIHSSAGIPPVITLRRGNGTPIQVLEDNARVAENLSAAGVRAPEFFTFMTSDSVVLNGYLIRPSEFNPSIQYPVLLYVYGGPGSQTVINAWGGDRYLWHQILARQGYLIASVDGRGTGGRGSAFKRSIYLRLGQFETQDQIEAARHLRRLPYVDPERIGIWGWSYGGFVSLRTLQRGGDLFRAGIAVTPPADWGLYDTIYTERYLRTPQENPEGYRWSAPADHVADLRSKVLLVHGTADDNAHFRHTLLIIDAMIEAGKQYDLAVYPGRTHSISGGRTRLHLFTTMSRWLKENL